MAGCVFPDCRSEVVNVARRLCGRHLSRVSRGVDAPPVDAGDAPSADWMAEAVCRTVDPELFFPVGSTGPALDQIADAKAVCHRCPVMAECLSWALDTGQDSGVWGGTSEDERRQLKTNARRMVTAGGAR